MSIKGRVERIKRRLPQMGWGERALFIIGELIHRHQSKFAVKNVWGGYVADPPWFQYFEPSDQPKTHENLAVVMGFGHSGSGAILDLLSEYDGVTTVYYPDCDISGNAANGFREFEILRHAGGLFSLEQAITSQYEAQKDAAVKSFLNLCAYLHLQVGGVFNDRFVEVTKQFLNSIILERISTKSSPDCTWVHCPHLRVFGTCGDTLFFGGDKSSSVGGIYLLKKLSISEYRALAHEYLMGIFDIIPSDKLLVLDQALQDSFCDMERYQDYVGPFKAIYSIRDPRDVYVTGVRLNELWIPRDPVIFSYWYREERGVERCVAMSHPDALVVRFEDLVLSYDETVKRIEKHLNLSSAQHLFPKQKFIPKISRRNVGCYKTFEDQSAIDEIARLLPDFCFKS